MDSSIERTKGQTQPIVEANVRLLQEHIYRASPKDKGLCREDTISAEHLYRTLLKAKGLSRMRGNSHVRFLGGWRVVTLSGYPV